MMTYQAGSLPGLGWVSRARTPWGYKRRVGVSKSVNRPKKTALPPLVCEVLKVASARYEVTIDDILGDSHARAFSYPRQFVAWSLYEMRLPDGSRRFSMPQIGRYLRRDHTTILHAIRAHEQRVGVRA